MDGGEYVPASISQCPSLPRVTAVAVEEVEVQFL